MCVHEQAHTLGLTCVCIARSMLLHVKTIVNLRELPARPECMWSMWLAAEKGHVGCLRYVHENSEVVDCKICLVCNAGTVAEIASRGNLEMLQYAHEHGVPWNEYACLEAAENGHLECLRYAHEHGCPWDESIVYCCIYSDNSKCLQYILENDNSFDLKKINLWAMIHGKRDCFHVLQQHLIKCSVL